MKTFTFENIQSEAELFAANYHIFHDVPKLPDENILSKYKVLVLKKYPEAVRLVKVHTEQFDSEAGHGFEHLEWVLSLSGFIAGNECKKRNIIPEQAVKILETTLLSGLFHDIERHRGFGEDHMIEGAKVAEGILKKLEINLPQVVTIVRNHDHLNFKPQNDLGLEIAFGSVFDADHFRYGLEREDTFWRMKEKKSKLVSDVIHDYKFLPGYVNAWHTIYGKEVGPKFIEFGLAIARHIEEKFS